MPHLGIDVARSDGRAIRRRRGRTRADEWIDETRAAGATPVVVGGTGLYLRALFEGLFEEPPLDRRASRRARAPSSATLPTEELRRWVQSARSRRARISGARSCFASIEIALLTGRRLSDLHRERRAPAPLAPALSCGGSRAGACATASRARIDDMLDDGWPDEVQRLMRTVPADAPAWNATGYDAVRRLVAGELVARRRA